MTDISNTPTRDHTVFYDGDCALCVRLRNRWGRLLTTRGFEFVPYQNGIAEAPFPAEDFGREMKLRMSDGRWFGGVDAYIQFFRAIVWLRPLAFLLRFATPRRMAERIYRRIAETRHCANGHCSLGTQKPTDRWIPLVLLPTAVLALQNRLEPWVMMWELAFAIFAGCKWLTLRDTTIRQMSTRDALLFLLAWPGMNRAEFLNRRTNRCAAASSNAPWSAMGRIALGALILWGGLPMIADLSPLLLGWVAMFGLICLLHFGVLDLTAWACRAYRWNARPLMLQPLRSKTIAEFWGVRWNTAFTHLARHYIYRPAARWIGSEPAMVVVFLVSGLVHDLVITVPAGGGYGLPTVYFMIQAAGMLMEKRIFTHKGRNGSTALHRAFTMTILTAPIGLLFPPVFVQNIILPMLQAFGIN